MSGHSDELRKQIASHRFWYHKIELPGGLVTPGGNPLDASIYDVPADLTGKRVLDVGAWDGYWTFAALKRGAREVVAIDDFSDFMGNLDQSDRPAWATFDLCRDAFGFDHQRCQRREMSVYDISEAALGRFDVVFFFGTLYHLRHPLLALDRLSGVCDDLLCVESFVCDDFSPYRGGNGHGYPGGQMVMEFYPDDQLEKNRTNWWGPTLACMAHMVRSAGFNRVNAWTLVDNPKHAGFSRGFVQGFKRAAGPPVVDPPRAST